MANQLLVSDALWEVFDGDLVEIHEALWRAAGDDDDEPTPRVVVSIENDLWAEYDGDAGRIIDALWQVVSAREREEA